jgi:hypothetical protein
MALVYDGKMTMDERRAKQHEIILYGGYVDTYPDEQKEYTPDTVTSTVSDAFLVSYLYDLDELMMPYAPYLRDPTAAGFLLSFSQQVTSINTDESRFQLQEIASVLVESLRGSHELRQQQQTVHFSSHPTGMAPISGSSTIESLTAIPRELPDNFHEHAYFRASQAYRRSELATVLIEYIATQARQKTMQQSPFLLRELFSLLLPLERFAENWRITGEVLADNEHWHRGIVADQRARSERAVAFLNLLNDGENEDVLLQDPALPVWQASSPAEPFNIVETTAEDSVDTMIRIETLAEVAFSTCRKKERLAVELGRLYFKGVLPLSEQPKWAEDVASEHPWSFSNDSVLPTRDLLYWKEDTDFLEGNG